MSDQTSLDGCIVSVIMETEVPGNMELQSGAIVSWRKILRAYSNSWPGRLKPHLGSVRGRTALIASAQVDDP